MKNKSITRRRQMFRHAERPNGHTVAQVDMTDRKTDSDSRVIMRKRFVVSSMLAVSTSYREREHPTEERLV